MMRVLVSAVMLVTVSACAPDFSMPTSPEGWERRQQGIEKREEDRRAFCRTRDASNERYRELCSRSGDTES